MIAHGVPGLDIQQAHQLPAAPAAAFAALTVQIDAWWPAEQRLVGGRMALVPALGSAWTETGANGAATWGIVDLIEPERRLYLHGWFGARGVVMGRVHFDLHPEAGGTRLILLHQAIGPVSEDRVSVHRTQWREALGGALVRHLAGTPVVTPRALADWIHARCPGPRRALVALAGAPGSGKSTLAEALATALGAGAAVMPMDGYHLDNAILDARGDRPRKGAPWTFDVAGLARDLARLRADDGPVLVPVFDRALDLSRASAREIGPGVRIVIVEGNYLLLGQAPWAALASFWDLTLSLDVPEDVLRTRLVARWRDHGHDAAAAEARALANDLPNAMTVRAHSRPADLVVPWVQPAGRPEPSIR